MDNLGLIHDFGGFSIIEGKELVQSLIMNLLVSLRNHGDELLIDQISLLQVEYLA